MKTTTQNTVVHYFPQTGLLMYEIDGKMAYGFGGAMADQLLGKAMLSGMEVIIEKPVIVMKNAKIKQFHAILAKKGLMDMKADIIAQYGVESTTELTDTQLDELISNLNNADTPANIRAARSSVLNQLGKLGITGSKENGWESVNNYLLQPRIAGKTLYTMTLLELEACTRKLRAILNKQ